MNAPRRVENVQTDRGSIPVYATGVVGVQVLDAAGLGGGHFAHPLTVSGLRRNQVAKLRKEALIAQ